MRRDPHRVTQQYHTGRCTRPSRHLPRDARVTQNGKTLGFLGRFPAARGHGFLSAFGESPRAENDEIDRLLSAPLAADLPSPAARRLSLALIIITQQAARQTKSDEFWRRYLPALRKVGALAS